MKIELRDYQVKILNDLKKEFQTKKEAVIAACPSSGKTVMTMKFIQDNPGKRFLILTHGTNILKEQWRSELSEKGILASDIPGEHNVCYGLPQGHRQLQALKSLDFLVVDEAHEFTFAKTVQNLITRLNPKKIIYLTGTPSKFILKGYKPLIVPAIDLIEKQQVSDLYVGMVSTNAKLDDDSFNSDGDVAESSHKHLEKSVNSDLDNLLGAMHKRLSETGAFKGNPTARRLVQWAPTLGKLHKTMIACKSIKQAEKIEAYFVRHQIPVISSNSINDPDTLNIQRFIDESDLRVLVVVDRGILGFNMPELVNVVDLTCSRNIDRIYQLYARVMRKNDTYKQKYFFKFSTEEHMLISKFYMNAALMLMFPDFIGKYNGRNLNGCEVLVHKPRSPREEKAESEKKDSTEEKTLSIDKVFYDTVTAGAMLLDVLNKIGNSTNEYAYVTFGEIQKGVFGSKASNGYWTKVKCQEILLRYKSRGSAKKEVEGRTALSVAYKEGWIDELCAHMTMSIKRSNYEECLASALKYSNKTEWSKHDSSRYHTAHNQGWIEKCCAHMTGRKRWTFETCKKEASKFKHRVDWIKNGKGYGTAVSNGWLIECCKHMKTKLGKSVMKKVKNLTTGQVFDSMTAAADSIKVSVHAIGQAARRNNKSGGYRWAYVE